MQHKSKILEIDPNSLPVSGLGPDGKLKPEGDEERRLRLEAARVRLREIAEIPDGPDDPSDEEMLRMYERLGWIDANPEDNG